MTILLILASMIITGHLVYYYSGYSLNAEMTGEILCVVGYLLIGVALICLPLFHVVIGGEIQEFKSVESTLDNARSQNIEKLESAAFQIEVAKSNRWLASVQYYNGSAFDIWVPDEVENLEPIN